MSFFLAIEGADGSGTTTQTRLVAERLRTMGYVVHETREPSSGPVGRFTREQLSARSDLNPKSLALLFAADRLDHIEREIAPSLARGEVCISDRYVLSSYAYQALDCDLDWVISINAFARTPDLCVLLDVPLEVSAARRSMRRGDPERFETNPLQERILANYKALAPRFNVCCVDGSQAPEQITSTILQLCLDIGM